MISCIILKFLPKDNKNLKIIEGDIRDTEYLKKCCKDYLFHSPSM